MDEIVLAAGPLGTNVHEGEGDCTVPQGGEAAITVPVGWITIWVVGGSEET